MKQVFGALGGDDRATMARLLQTLDDAMAELITGDPHPEEMSAHGRTERRRPAADERPPLADPVHRRHRPADGDPRLHHREHRAALSPALTRIPQQRAAVGGHGLPPGPG